MSNTIPNLYERLLDTWCYTLEIRAIVVESIDNIDGKGIDVEDDYTPPLFGGPASVLRKSLCEHANSLTAVSDMIADIVNDMEARESIDHELVKRVEAIHAGIILRRQRDGED